MPQYRILLTRNVTTQQEALVNIEVEHEDQATEEARRIFSLDWQNVRIDRDPVAVVHVRKLVE